MAAYSTRMKPGLPEPLPDDPLPLLKSWIDEAQREIRNATAMTVATVEPDGRPAARMIICRGLDPVAGWLIFYTHDVADAASRYGCTPQQLDEIAGFAKAHSEVLPVRDVVSRLGSAAS